jgi:large subunit ribosomal protein L6
MSRVGKQSLALPQGVTVENNGSSVVVKGPKGTLTLQLNPRVTVRVENGEATVHVTNPDLKSDRALWGTYASLLKNMIQGVVKPYEKKLEINGIGFKALSKGDKIELSVGFSHKVLFPVPAGVTAAINENIITLTGVDKQLVGETAAQIRAVKKPEPYKGKGIKYVDEVIHRKAGKAGKAAA